MYHVKDKSIGVTTRCNTMEHDGTRWNTMEQDGTRWNKMEQDGYVVTYRSNQASWVVVDFQVVVQIPVLHVRGQSGNSSISLALPYSVHRTKNRLVHTNLVQRLKNTMHNLPTNWVASCTSTPAHTPHHCQRHRPQWHRHCPRHVRSRTRAWQCCRCWCLRGRAGCA